MDRTGRIQLLSITMVLSLILGLMLPFAPSKVAKAEENDSELINQAAEVKSGDSIEATFDKPGIRWYVFKPNLNDIKKFTHVELNLKSKDLLNISIYSSKKNALEEKTFGQYRAGTDYSMKPAEVAFPYAWDGPYYIKVEYFGKAEIEEIKSPETTPDSNAESETNKDTVTTEQEEVTSDTEEELDLSTTYTLSVKDVKKQPAKEDELSSCPVEMSAAAKKSGGKALLQSIRQFRDGTLAKSQAGREMSALYYKAAPFVMVKVAKDSNARDRVYKNLMTLQPLIKDLNNNGLDSSYVISKSEQAAIEELYNFVADASPGILNKEMQKLANKAGIKSLAGDQAASTMTKMGVKLSGGSGTGGKLLIKMKPGKSVDSISAARSVKSYNVSKAEPVDEDDTMLKDLYVFDLEEQLPKGMSAKAVSATATSAAKQIEALPEVEYVEKAQKYQVHSEDIQYSYQWSLSNRGQNGGTNGADIRNAALQNLVNKRNLKQTVIAVVDTGVDNSLTDLKNSVDMSIGKNFVDPNEPATDDYGHGTHVAGIIAAAANNDYSMAGINQKARIMPVKVLNAAGFGDTEEIAYGIKYAADHGAKVINLSLGGEYSRTLEYVLKYAYSKGIIIVAASGNENVPELSYPAASKYTISVGGTNSLDVVSDFSNYGNALDLVAPGSNIPSLVPNGNVTYMSGTSMAAPHVSATVGLMLSRNPKLKFADVRTALKETAKKNTFVPSEEPEEFSGEYEVDKDGNLVEVKPDVPAGSDMHAGFGRLNAYNAFSAVDLNVKLKPVLDNRRIITGTAVKGAKVEVKKGKTVLAKGTVNTKGAFSMKIPAQTNKTELYVTVSAGDVKTTVRTYVAKGKAPASPKVNKVTNKSSYATGTAPLDTKVVLTNKSKKVIAQGAVNSKGQFKLKMAKQKAGTVLYAKSVDPAKRNSKQVKVTVAKAK
ncbi:S8 family serine peptidase [Aciduricibacillus chroicocephali]|uniref:S8 family serine peptidase n=1 Tax=Aciduricibacillus chroicocephali TaxID=3054939 RepID=A0ABY9KTN4_9BACI|nr:S8 family serine peptidase [Bacillaceae bacterium 44XB]